MEEQVVVENEGLSFSDIWKVIKKYWIGLVSIIAGSLIIGVLAAYFVVPKKFEASQNLYYYAEASQSKPENTKVNLNETASVMEYVFSRLKDRTVYEKTALRLTADTNNFKEPVDYKVLMEELTMDRPDNLTIRFNYVSKQKQLIPLVLNTFTDEALQFIDSECGFKFRITHDIREDDIYDSSTSKFLVVGASGVVGLIIGLCYEFIANSSDKTIRNKSYLETTYGIKVIGLIPDLEKLNNNDSEE